MMTIIIWGKIMISSPPLRNPSSSFCLGSGFAKQCVSEDIVQYDHEVCRFLWYSHWNGNFNSWFFSSNLCRWRHQDGLCNSNCNGCCLPSNVSLKTSPWRHPDEHDKLCLFDDMGIGMAIQMIKMSFFLSSNLCWWRHQDDHRLFDDVCFLCQWALSLF